MNMDYDQFEYSIGLVVESLITSLKEIDFMSVEDTSVISNNIGLDIGTMNIVMAKNLADNKISTHSFRNVFLKVDTDSLGTRDLSTISHTVIDDSTYILSEDAYIFGNIFGQQVSRPMSKGMISNSEIDSIDILSVIIGALIGNSTNPNSICCYSIPANPIDVDMNVLFHKNVFSRIIEQLNYKPLPLYEAVSLIYSECQNSDFTGIGISFGAGMTNIAIVFKGVEVSNFSLARGGDWIDEQTSSHIAGLVSNRVTLVKEKDDFDISNFITSNKKERRIREALSYYYNDLIKYTIDHIVKKLEKIDIAFPDKIPVIISGGTSKAKGFLDIFINEFNSYEFPFEISEIRHANNPLTAVSEGCLIRALKH